ncbi:hypothetical protein HYFRA_00009723 [Hymenoscyphus fraxineus]|uniref:Uncharacterized protein n=1 Tax=Hymenoscyphus fraxineus TaxID=746836 RepID=A0A9N9KW67_9HELO|nr:hypothetical protein HYFRA_00009723 [Hymenoscyphus fraxineus]
MNQKQKPFDTCSPADTNNAINRARASTDATARKIITNPGMSRKRDLALVTKRGSTPLRDPSEPAPHSYCIASAVGYIYGDLQDNDNYCERCERGSGIYPFCVTVSDWTARKKFFGGGCVNCRYTDHPERCSLNKKKKKGMLDMDESDPPGPPDGRRAPDNEAHGDSAEDGDEDGNTVAEPGDGDVDEVISEAGNNDEDTLAGEDMQSVASDEIMDIRDV